jgi:hypothetical protein
MPLKELTAGRIDGGIMLDGLNQAIQKLGEEVCKNFALYDSPEGAKGKVTLDIEIFRHPEINNYGIRWSVKKVSPQLPKSAVTYAKEVKGLLMCQASGSDRDLPEQESFLEDAEEKRRERDDERG